jgi:AcrR family transcriptional regulator/DNA-binding MarR family transcriptional regulator
MRVEGNHNRAVRSVVLPLPSGSNGLSRAQVRAIQRARLIAAAVDTVEELGYARMTVARVISRAGISRKTFYDIFADREDCFLAAFEHALAEASRVAIEVSESECGWREETRVALARLLVFVEQEPSLARLLIVESLLSGARVLRRRGQVLDELATLIDRGRPVNSLGTYPPCLTAAGVVGGVLALLHARLLTERPQPFTDLFGPLMSMIVLPYLGAKAAREEVDRPGSPPRPDTKRVRHPAAEDPLKGLNMRLTYRSMRVLAVIAQHPAACNRDIADRSGIVDQGQVSKLLARLARLNLAENVGKGQQAGAPNAWRLTPLGAKLERAASPLSPT